MQNKLNRTLRDQWFVMHDAGGPWNQAQLEQSAIAVLGQMTAGATHDFRNLLSVIDSALRIAERNLEFPAVARKYIDGARNGVERGLKLIRDLAPLLKLISGPTTHIKLRLRSDIPKVRVEKFQFDAAILNLVANARDATPEGGEIRIVTDCVEDPNEAGRSCVCVSVQDVGPGITCETMEQIFEPFFTTKGAGGTGLGLPQVRAFINSNHGRLTVKSDPAHGTAFDLFFPPCEHSDKVASNGVN
jgi:signal transduction histidine kinase